MRQVHLLHLRCRTARNHNVYFVEPAVLAGTAGRQASAVGTSLFATSFSSGTAFHLEAFRAISRIYRSCYGNTGKRVFVRWAT